GRTSPVLAGTPLENARITGRLATLVDYYGGMVRDAIQENDEFYAAAKRTCSPHSMRTPPAAAPRPRQDPGRDRPRREPRPRRPAAHRRTARPARVSPKRVRPAKARREKASLAKESPATARRPRRSRRTRRSPG